MSACLVEKDVEAFGQSALSDFDREVSEISKDLCAPFFREANRLEAKLTTIFQVVSRMARNEPDTENVAKLWCAMAQLCQKAEIRVSELSQAHPKCNADYFFDHLYQLKSKCKRLQTMHS